MPCPERDQTIYVQEKEVKTVKTFKYLGSMFDANGGAEKDVNNRVNIAWSKWRETTGVMCDRNIPTKLIDKVYKTAIKPAMCNQMVSVARQEINIIALLVSGLECPRVQF